MNPSTPTPGPLQPATGMPAGRRVLFVAEAVTLAHVARPLALSRALADGGIALAFACDPRCHWLLGDFPGTVHALGSIPGAAFLDALARGRPVYDAATLERYVADDLRLLGELRPDLVVGDFRLSLSVSARLAGIPYFTISNAYWSPYVRQRYPVPGHPLLGRIGLPAAQALFSLARPLVFARHAAPLERVRRCHGLPTLGFSLHRAYTDADCVLYADVPEMFSMRPLPETHGFLGPVLWSPPVPRPGWWADIPPQRPAVYVTLGSSGRAGLLPAVLAALADLPVTVLAAGGGHPLPASLPANALAADYLPGVEAAQLSRLVVCNGGSPTSQQALAAGVPVLGLPGNLDQFLNMQAVAASGAGLLLRADRADTACIRRAALQLLEADAPMAAARRMAQTFARHPAGPRFRQRVEAVTGERGR